MATLPDRECTACTSEDEQLEREAMEEFHHPGLHLSRDEVVLEMWTHEIDGLHESDFRDGRADGPHLRGSRGGVGSASERAPRVSERAGGSRAEPALSFIGDRPRATAGRNADAETD